MEWLADQGLERLPQFVTALAIGLLIGLERERNPTAKAGLRTFALIALTGALAEWLAERLAAPSIVGIGFVLVTATMIAAYYHHHEASQESDPGTTTIAAVAACYLLAAMVLAGSGRLAVILATAMVTLLYFKAELRGVAQGLERRDLISILQFAVVTFVVLPLLPDRGYGPYAALNPRHIWLMVVLISAVSLVGYVSLRVFGQKYGALLLGLSGGIVSSTATTLAYARHVRTGDAPIALGETVILTSNLVLPVRLAVIVALLAPELLVSLAPPLAGGLLAALAVYLLARRGDLQRSDVAPLPRVNNPSELRTALAFAALYALVLFVAAAVEEAVGSKGVYALAAVSGLTDMDAITLSGLRMFEVGSLSAAQTTAVVVIALSTSSIFKLGIVSVAGGGQLVRRCLPVIGAMVIGTWLGFAGLGR